MGEGGKVDGGLAAYYSTKIDQLELQLHDKMQDLKRLEAQRNDLNSRGECLLVCA
jgi:26S proteasome regulatory subunit T6